MITHLSSLGGAGRADRPRPGYPRAASAATHARAFLDCGTTALCGSVHLRPTLCHTLFLSCLSLNLSLSLHKSLLCFFTPRDRCATMSTSTGALPPCCPPARVAGAWKKMRRYGSAWPGMQRTHGHGRRWDERCSFVLSLCNRGSMCCGAACCWLFMRESEAER